MIHITRYKGFRVVQINGIWTAYYKNDPIYHAPSLQDICDLIDS